MSQAPRPRDSASGRLLTELSWSGRSIRKYRLGGAGFENVLTAEVMQALDLLPRTAFLGAVLEQAHGADQTRESLVREVEQAEVTLLPGDMALNPDGYDKRTQVLVQPDATITSPSVFALVEAKRIRRSSFQPEQLAREYVAATVDAEASGRRPLLLLILGSPPPVTVSGWPQPVAISNAVERAPTWSPPWLLHCGGSPQPSPTLLSGTADPPKPGRECAVTSLQGGFQPFPPGTTAHHSRHQT